MTTAQIGILVLAFIGLVLLLAIAANRIHRCWKHRPTWRETEARPLKTRILPPHKSAARPSNVTTIARKPAFKSPPKTAA